MDPPGQGSAMEGALSSKDSPWGRMPIAWPLPGLFLIVAGTRPLKALRNSDCAPRARRNISRGPKRLLFINFLLSERKEIVASKATPLRMPSQHNYKLHAWQHNSCSPPARAIQNEGHSPQQGFALEPNEYSMAFSRARPPCCWCARTEGPVEHRLRAPGAEKK